MMHRYFTCVDCGKNFATSSGLKQHQHIHKSIKPFQCKVCCRSYTQFSNLCRHKRMHADCRQQIDCGRCGQTFTTIASLNKHKRFCEGQNSPNVNNYSLPSKLYGQFMPLGQHFHSDQISIKDDHPEDNAQKSSEFYESPLKTSVSTGTPKHYNTDKDGSKRFPLNLPMNKLFERRRQQQLPCNSPVVGLNTSSEQISMKDVKTLRYDLPHIPVYISSVTGCPSNTIVSKPSPFHPLFHNMFLPLCEFRQSLEYNSLKFLNEIETKHSSQSVSSEHLLAKQAKDCLIKRQNASESFKTVHEENGIDFVQNKERHPPNFTIEFLLDDKSKEVTKHSTLKRVTSDCRDEPVDLTYHKERILSTTIKNIDFDARTDLCKSNEHDFHQEFLIRNPQVKSKCESFAEITSKSKYNSSDSEQQQSFVFNLNEPMTPDSSGVSENTTSIGSKSSPHNAESRQSFTTSDDDTIVPISSVERVRDDKVHPKEKVEPKEDFTNCFNNIQILPINRNVNYQGAKERYSCRYCFKQFPRSANLTRHLRTHTGEQPYRCQFCRRRFSISSNLQRHVRNIHNKEKPFHCRMCDRRFGQQTNLDRHYKKHENQKQSVAPDQFRCPDADGQQTMTTSRVGEVLRNQYLSFQHPFYHSISVLSHLNLHLEKTKENWARHKLDYKFHFDQSTTQHISGKKDITSLNDRERHLMLVTKMDEFRNNNDKDQIVST